MDKIIYVVDAMSEFSHIEDWVKRANKVVFSWPRTCPICNKSWHTRNYDRLPKEDKQLYDQLTDKPILFRSYCKYCDATTLVI